jgi:cytochrome c oxidase subunit II
MTTRSWQHLAAAAALFTVAAGSAGRTTASVAPRPAVKEFTIVAERYKFTPNRIEVNQGDTVRITVKSADGTHGFAIKKMKIEETVPKGGQPVTIEFVAGASGSFAITCSEYCGRGHSQMKGTIEVAAAGQGGDR